MMKKNYRHLYLQLGYTFRNEALLIEALTHRSTPKSNNERLEFLGDSIVNFIAAELVYTLFPLLLEGDLSRLRTSLVRGETLGMLAKSLHLGDYLHLGPGELRAGGAHRESILADAMEAVIAAIYLDSNIENCKKCVLKWLEPFLTELTEHKAAKDPKTQLQEYLQGRGIALPQYQVTAIEGLAHEQIFTVECWIISLERKTYGKGSSRRRAEQQSAQMMLATFL